MKLIFEKKFGKIGLTRKTELDPDCPEDFESDPGAQKSGYPDRAPGGPARKPTPATVH